MRSEAVDRQRLIETESDLYLPPTASRYGVTLTVKDTILSPNAGVDESNGDGFFILWPQNPQKVVNQVRQHLCQRFGLHQVGVILTDSSPVPLRWGVNGVVMAHSGFAALNDYIGKPDLFGRPLRMTTVNVANALAVAAVLIMGEGNESTPMAIINDLPPLYAFNPATPLRKSWHHSTSTLQMISMHRCSPVWIGKRVGKIAILYYRHDSVRQIFSFTLY